MDLRIWDLELGIWEFRARLSVATQPRRRSATRRFRVRRLALQTAHSSGFKLFDQHIITGLFGEPRLASDENEPPRATFANAFDIRIPVSIVVLVNGLNGD